MAIERQLAKSGLEVCQRTNNGEDAVHSAELDLPDLILRDIRLGEHMDGIEAPCRIRAFSQAPIIFMTGYLDEATQSRAIAVPQPFGEQRNRSDS